jgi:hypothetical protein
MSRVTIGIVTFAVLAAVGVFCSGLVAVLLRAR